jgi:Domain of unknown function (DUF4281)
MPSSPATLFQLANLLALSGWLVLLANALMRRPAMLWPARIVPLILAAAYLATVAPLLPGSKVDFGSMAGVQALFGNSWWVLAGWMHYLAFDILIGCWQTDRALRSGLPRGLLVICLFLTFMFGPVGWLLFIVLTQFFAKEKNHVA